MVFGNLRMWLTINTKLKWIFIELNNSSAYFTPKTLAWSYRLVLFCASVVFQNTSYFYLSEFIKMMSFDQGLSLLFLHLFTMYKWSWKGTISRALLLSFLWILMCFSLCFTQTEKNNKITQCCSIWQNIIQTADVKTRPNLQLKKLQPSKLLCKFSRIILKFPFHKKFWRQLFKSIKTPGFSVKPDLQSSSEQQIWLK